MFHISPSSCSQAYTSYLPRGSYFPASSGIGDATLLTYAVDDLEYYPSSPHSFLAPSGIDAETRYHRALYELDAAEQEYQAHVALERARQAAAAEAARLEREIALYAEVERIKRAGALQEQVEERLFERAHRRSHAPIHAMYDDAKRDYDPQGHHVRPQLDNETLTIGDVWGLFSWVNSEYHRASPRQRPTLSTSQPHRPTELQTQSQPPEHEKAEVNLSNILEFFHSIAAQARGAGDREQSSDENLPSQPEAAAVEGKGKGKAKTQPVPECTLVETLFREIVGGAHDQGLRDIEYAIEYAIELSLQDRDATDVKKAHASKASQSSPGASSSKVKVEGPSSSGREGCSNRNSAPVSDRVSPLTSIRAVRTQFSALESAFKFPLILDFDHSELAATSNNAPVRAYEHALNGLLERLDAIESDGNEEVREVRRGVVREVERALEEVERKVKEQAPRAPVTEATKQEASDAESEDSSAPVSQAVPPAVVHVTKSTKPTFTPVASQADADIDLVISEEYQSASPVSTPSGVVVTERESSAGAAPANGETSTVSGDDAEIDPASEDGSDSLATISAAPVAPAVAVPSSSDKSSSTSAGAGETFLTSLPQEQFTFPPRPAFSQSSRNSGVPQDDDAVLVDNSSEGGSVRSVDDEWTAGFDA